VGELGGGDFHCIVHRQPGKTAFVIGDISGHDFASAIVATKVVDYIEEHEDALMHPNLFLHSASEDLFEYLSSYGRFFTAGLCVADVENNIISYASAGHPNSLLLSAETGDVTRVGGTSLPVGFDKGVSYVPEQHHFLPGDILLMMTDGISSARSAERDEFGVERIENVLRMNAKSPMNVVSHLRDALKIFAENSHVFDDETIIAVIRK